jgi:uncharacterized membrane protein
VTTSRRRQATGGPTALTVWHYDSAVGAEAGEVRLHDLENREALTVIDAITVAWMPNAAQPRVRQVTSPTRRGARRGAVLGALVGALALAPVAGATAGAGVGALVGRLGRAGIDDAFLQEMKRRLAPGTSALLVLSKDADLDEIRPLLERGRSRGHVTLLHAVLGDEGSDALRELLATMPSFPVDSSASGEPAVLRSPLPSQEPAPSGRSPRPKEPS